MIVMCVPDILLVEIPSRAPRPVSLIFRRILSNFARMIGGNQSHPGKTRIITLLLGH